MLALLQQDISLKHISLMEEKNLKVEGVAKLLCPEKSMILRPFASGNEIATPPFDSRRPPVGRPRIMGANGLKRAILTGK